MLSNKFAFRIWRVVALAVLLINSSCAPSGASIKVVPSASSVQINDTLTVPIKIENVANLTAFEIHLSFDPAVLEVVEVKDGGFIKADFSVQNAFDNTAGTLDYAVAQLNRSPVKGSGTLLEIVFRAKAGGSSPIGFRVTEAAPTGVLLSDANGMAIQVSLADGTLTVK